MSIAQELAMSNPFTQPFLRHLWQLNQNAIEAGQAARAADDQRRQAELELLSEGWLQAAKPEAVLIKLAHCFAATLETVALGQGRFLHQARPAFSVAFLALALPP